MNYFKLLPIAAVALFSLNASAVQKDITVSASVDTTLEMLSADGSALPATMQMQYLPGSGLQATKVMTKVFTNDISKDIQVSLANEPSLANMTNNSGDAIPLAVTFNGQALTTTPVTLAAKTLFTGSDVSQGSNPMQLSIEQKTPAAVTAAGNYQGVVSVILTQAAASGGGGGK